MNRFISESRSEIIFSATKFLEDQEEGQVYYHILKSKHSLEYQSYKFDIDQS
jgi:hypothetical protein